MERHAALAASAGGQARSARPPAYVAPAALQPVYTGALARLKISRSVYILCAKAQRIEPWVNKFIKDAARTLLPYLASGWLAAGNVGFALGSITLSAVKAIYNAGTEAQLHKTSVAKVVGLHGLKGALGYMPGGSIMKGASALVGAAADREEWNATVGQVMKGNFFQGAVNDLANAAALGSTQPNSTGRYFGAYSQSAAIGAGMALDVTPSWLLSAIGNVGKSALVTSLTGGGTLAAAAAAAL